MNSIRLKQLFKFLEEDPQDPFLIYAIATEYREDSPEKARQYFELLLKEHENYIGTYYHAAKLYADLEENTLAKATFEKGIQLAQKTGNALALRELKSAYDEFLFDE